MYINSFRRFEQVWSFVAMQKLGLHVPQLWHRFSPNGRRSTYRLQMPISWAIIKLQIYIYIFRVVKIDLFGVSWERVTFDVNQCSLRGSTFCLCLLRLGLVVTGAPAEHFGTMIHGVYVHLALWTRYVLRGNCYKFSCIKFHSLIHA